MALWKTRTHILKSAPPPFPPSFSIALSLLLLTSRGVAPPSMTDLHRNAPHPGTSTTFGQLLTWRAPRQATPSQTPTSSLMLLSFPPSSFSCPGPFTMGNGPAMTAAVAPLLCTLFSQVAHAGPHPGSPVTDVDTTRAEQIAASAEPTVYKEKSARLKAFLAGEQHAGFRRV